MLHRSCRLFAIGVLICLSPFLGGCLNPELINQTFGGLYPTAPGDTPFVLTSVVNQTTADLDLRIFADDGSVQPPFNYFVNLRPEDKMVGTLFDWPMIQISIGDPNNVNEPSVVATYPNGLTVQIPFGRPPLVAGQDFDSGDAIVFLFTEDPRSETGIALSVGIIDGATQQGPFTRADTFETIRLLLIRNGFMIP
ncbi:MAG: hypothetical protein JSV03_09820 [Planctomycetota bacterium]|nr:MAG: hypothetical protein JSV03_09820 [Planctomycetota bacterium]